jgi:hypothetical protein
MKPYNSSPIPFMGYIISIPLMVALYFRLEPKSYFASTPSFNILDFLAEYLLPVYLLALGIWVILRLAGKKSFYEDTLIVVSILYFIVRFLF